MAIEHNIKNSNKPNSNSNSKKGVKKKAPKRKSPSWGNRLLAFIRSLGGSEYKQQAKLQPIDKLRTILGLSLLGLFLFVFITLVFFVFDAKAIYSQVHSHMPLEDLDSDNGAIGSLGSSVGYYLFNHLFGWGSLSLSFLLFYVAIALIWIKKEQLPKTLGRASQLLSLSLWLSLFLASVQRMFHFEDSVLSWGGLWGVRYSGELVKQFGHFGLILFLGLSLLIILVLFSNKVLLAVNDPARLKQKSASWCSLARWRGSSQVEEDEFEEEDEEQSDTYTNEDEELERDQNAYLDDPSRLDTSSESISIPLGDEDQVDDLIITTAPSDELVEAEELDGNRPPGMLLELYRKPSIELLREYSPGGIEVDKQEIETTKQRILDTLASFKISVTPHKATIGPTVTLYEIIPDQGVKVARIKSLENDLMLALKSQGIRIIAPMPGQGTVGIEVPNRSPQTVSMRSIMASKKFSEASERMELPIGMGKTITNEPFIFDLAKMPHILIAGATGQGKSVGLNALITSLLYSKRPEELKIIMVDPKMLEFSVYEGLENHFMAVSPDADRAIITDMAKVVPTLNSLCIEMDNRYRILSEAKVRNIKDYNEQVRQGNLSRVQFDFLPYIVLIVDEWADLIMTSGREAEQPIARLAQKARAAGIHLVLATQRPSTDVVTGLIKANFPARIAFKVSSHIDSGTILGNPSAHNLVGRGDMLFFQGNELIRVQCAFMDTPETEAIVEHIARQESPGHPYELPEYVPEGDSKGPKEFNASRKDELFEDAARLVVSSQMGSASLIQRKMEIGFARAGRLVDQLEATGVVGPQRGSKPREVLIQDISTLEALLEQLK